MAIIFHHSKETSNILIAKQLAAKSFKIGNKEGGWLESAAEDRFLVRTENKQKWGTQFFKDENSQWQQYEIVSDDESGLANKDREERGVPKREDQMRIFLNRSDI